MSADKASIWAELLRVTRWWHTEATQDDLAHKHVLHAAALAYADAVRASGRDVKPTPTRVSDDRGDTGAVFPNYGKTAGQPVRGARKGDLEFYKRGCERMLADPNRSRWHEKERALLAAINDELAKYDDADADIDSTDTAMRWDGQ